MDKEILLTKEKYAELEAELNELKHVTRKEIAENLEYAKSLGDLSENAEYHEARDKQAEVEDRINHLEQVLKVAKIVAHKKSDVVSLGSEVTVERNGSKATYTIVGSEEADMTKGKLSAESPFGLAIMGKKKGDKFSYKTPGGEMAFVIVDVK
ncbi:MAG: transcription elongation factor GreA [Candidatus Zambryskibacteria bacterium CG10_big_fil_rev_8_21_14_0_10_42_12]|uniref:Transcription elongation factor GreA n=1 Tax=Candidatus Zambryskibacteria bacterium CG10_big_fil_rev_8_21_14_0_10_42_12 TaxID=1975115 RepID=A0A2H0QUF1_9BACT|nr:MAG: transcription elongation factor GreA [Candidatus Zambryskibacteria bacterium CG10_big_fil_rev_8_21_14_0_10_42_12]